MSDPYEIYDLINSIVDEEGLEGFDLYCAGLDPETRDIVNAALQDPAFSLELFQRMPSENPLWRAWYESKIEENRLDPKRAQWVKPLPDEWRVWLLLTGRGAGKTRSASCAVHHLARDVFPGGSGILVGTKHADVRDTMIRGPSGLLNTAPPGFQPRFNQHDNTIWWPNGSSAIIRTADNPEDLRGYTVNWAWADELVKWRSASTWDNLDLCVREQHPNGTRIILTTTPKGGKEWIKSIHADAQTITTGASSLDNPHQDKATLAKRRREQLVGGRKAQEEIDGWWAAGQEALWTPALIDGWRKKGIAVDIKTILASTERALISVDPAEGKGQDETGISIQGLKGGQVIVVADETASSSFETWTDRVAELAVQYLRDTDTILIEKNNFTGIDYIIRDKCRKRGWMGRVSTETSVNSKWYRAQEAFSHCVGGHVSFYGTFDKLETQLCEWEPNQKDSPDRGDAFTQGVNELLGSRGRGIFDPFNVPELDL